MKMIERTERQPDDDATPGAAGAVLWPDPDRSSRCHPSDGRSGGVRTTEVVA